MLEKRKEDSDGVGKYQTMLMSAIVASIIIWIAPEIIPILTGADGDIFTPPTTTGDQEILPEDVANRITDLFQLLLWFARIVVTMMVIVSVILLRVRPLHEVGVMARTPIVN